jgi:hypothetical protein
VTVRRAYFGSTWNQRGHKLKPHNTALQTDERRASVPAKIENGCHAARG